jgi:hypothetical protein
MSKAGLGLQLAVREVVAALLAADWARFSGDDGRFYYVIRESDRLALAADGRDWNGVTVQQARAQTDFEDWYVRAVLADPPSDHFEKARKAMKKAGLDSKLIDAVIAAANAADSEQELGRVVSEWLPQLVTQDEAGVGHLLAFLEAVRIEGTKSGHLFLSDAERQELGGAFELRFLRELAERFPKVVKRASDFDEWLSFYSPQLREALRCYLYGFFSAAILVAAAALDVRLNAVAHINGIVPYPVLVAAVFGIAGVLGHDPVLAAALEELFRYRNDVAHHGSEASAEKAIEVLTLVRATLDRIALASRDEVCTRRPRWSRAVPGRW